MWRGKLQAKKSPQKMRANNKLKEVILVELCLTYLIVVKNIKQCNTIKVVLRRTILMKDAH